MSQKRILKALTTLGLSQIDAEVYVYLADKGPQKRQKIAEEFDLQDSSLNIILGSLTTKRIVKTANEHVHLFYALPFDKTLELLLKENLKKAKIVEQNKDEILYKWQNLLKDSTEARSDNC